jgi:hypothetical protein
MRLRRDLQGTLAGRSGHFQSVVPVHPWRYVGSARAICHRFVLIADLCYPLGMSPMGVHQVPLPDVPPVAIAVTHNTRYEHLLSTRSGLGSVTLRSRPRNPNRIGAVR